MPRTAIEAGYLLVVAGTIAYPLLVWLGSSIVPPGLFVVLGLVLLAVRFATARNLIRPGAELFVLVLAGTALMALVAFAPEFAPRAYPVVLSLTVASVFGLSLRHPPTVIERLARLRNPQLSPRGIAYTGTVTAVWCGFLIVNAAVSAATALWASLDVWLLWNGLLSYLAMGTLFAGEWIIRQRVKRQVHG